jgi:hypothetical protein
MDLSDHQLVTFKQDGSFYVHDPLDICTFSGTFDVFDGSKGPYVHLNTRHKSGNCSSSVQLGEADALLDVYNSKHIAVGNWDLKKSVAAE